MMLRRLTLFTLLFAVGVAGVFVWGLFDGEIPPKSLPSSLLQREGEIAKAAGVVSLTLDFGDGNAQNFSDIPLVTGATAFSILEEAKVPIIYDPSVGAGVFVRQIGEKKNGDGGRYWQYWVNGKFALVAADRYALSTGDTVEWRFVFPEK